MRGSELLLAALLVAGCSIPLDHNSSDAGSTSSQPPMTAGCLLFQQANPSVALLQGAGLSLALADGSVLWSFSGATLTNEMSVSGGVLARVSGDDGRQCFPSTSVSTTPAFAPSPLGSQYLIVPLDLVRVGTAVWSYYQLFAFDSSAAFGLKSEGFGIAPFDSGRGQFIPTSNLLWAGDAPAFGTSAVVSGSDLYVYGCGQDSSGASACYVARADTGHLDDPTAYTYGAGPGFFSPSIEGALPIVVGAGSLNVRQHSSDRWLVTYAPPLGAGLVVRSALSPVGPFSQPHDLLTCDLGSGDFCTGGAQHPELDPDGETIAVSYSPATFNGTMPGARYWPRLVFVKLPDSLP